MKDKFCIDCANFKPAQFHGDSAVCLIDYTHNLVYGHREYRTCYASRHPGGQCGPLGLHFKDRQSDEVL